MLSFFLSLDERMGQKYYGGAERQETAEARAERILAQELRRRQWGLGELARRRKGDKEKVKIGRRLRNETTMTLNWIAERLAMEWLATRRNACVKGRRSGEQYAILRD